MTNHAAVLRVPIDSQELVSAFTTRAFGSLSTRADSPDAVALRYQSLADQLGLEIDNLFCLPQTHSNNVVILRDREFLQRPEGVRRFQFTENEISRGDVYLDRADFDMEWQRGIDGVILAVDNVFPVILTADCAPVMFWAPGSQVCGVAHIGLVGAVNQMAVRMVSLFQSEFGIEPDRLETAILPSIRGCHYNLSRSGVWKRLQRSIKELYGEENQYYRDGYFRLPEFIAWQLVNVGMRPEQINDLGICTVCQADQYFSHVQAGVTGAQEREGRFGSLIGMRRLEEQIPGVRT